MAAVPAQGDARDPVQHAALSETINTKIGQIAVDELLPKCLDWLALQALGPPEKDIGRVRAETTIAIRSRLPAFHAHLPLPICRIAYGSWILPAAAGAALGALVLTPLSHLLLEKREPGLLVGGIVGSALTVGLLAWLAERPSLLSALQKSVGVASLAAGLAGTVQFFKAKSFALLKTAGCIAACWILLLLVRPKLKEPTRDECRETLRPQIEGFLAHAIDLVLALSWFHPDRTPTDVKKSGGPPLPARVADSLGVLWAISEDKDVPVKHLLGAVQALLQRVREQGYEWKSVADGTPYDAALEEQFECFGAIEGGMKVEMLEPARVLDNKLDKPGQLRAL